MHLPEFLSEREGAVFLSLKVQPRAKQTELAGVIGAELKVKVTAPPVDSAANEAVLDFLAARLGVPRRSASLVRGRTSQHKVVRIEGLPITEIARRLVPPDRT